MSRISVAFTEESKRIGQVLKAVRIERNLSQEKVGELLGLTFQQIQKYEKGANRISLITAIKFCEVMNIDIKVFATGGEVLDILKLLNPLNPQQRATAIKVIKAVV
jgi:transcriptional regulator with XRE-family HTH domain